MGLTVKSIAKWRLSRGCVTRSEGVDSEEVSENKYSRLIQCDQHVGRFVEARSAKDRAWDIRVLTRLKWGRRHPPNRSLNFSGARDYNAIQAREGSVANFVAIAALDSLTIPREQASCVPLWAAVD